MVEQRFGGLRGRGGGDARSPGKYVGGDDGYRGSGGGSGAGYLCGIVDGIFGAGGGAGGGSCGYGDRSGAPSFDPEPSALVSTQKQKQSQNQALERFQKF